MKTYVTSIIAESEMETAGLIHLRAAVRELREAEDETGCAFCKAHVTELRVLAEDLVQVARLGEDAGRGEIGTLARRIGSLAERLGALGALGRVIHRVKGLR